MQEKSKLEEFRLKIRRSAGVKIVVIGILGLFLLIPASMVKSLISERRLRGKSVIREVSSKWGNEQTITGPVLTIPYTTYTKSDGKSVESKSSIHILPESLAVVGEITPKVRYRGIYEAILYNAQLTLSGVFDISEIKKLRNIAENDIDFQQSSISVGIPDMRGIESIEGKLNGKEMVVAPGSSAFQIINSGFNISSPIQGAMDKVEFSFDIDLRGSRKIDFAPVGKKTTVKLKSSWASPSFDGAFLPTKRKIDENGFSAEWNILDYNRNYPQCWSDTEYSIASPLFGVVLFKPTGIYQKSTRMAKYALLFIIFTFAAVFFSEVIASRLIHAIQYLFIGLSISLFYVLLISLSEHIGFNLSYLISTVAIIALIGGYAKCIFKSFLLSFSISSVLGLLYAYLFFVLQLKDYALLAGAVGLFAVLAVIMFATRKIDWFSLSLGKS